MERRLIKILKSLLGFNKATGNSQLEPDSATIDLIRLKLHEHMVLQQPFLKPHYKIKDLADDLQIPLHQLSAFLNKQLGMHFSDYLNQFRIRYCEDLIKREQPGRINFKGLVSRCGFHNRNTFTTAFKKFTGKTPSAYVRNRLYSWIGQHLQILATKPPCYLFSVIQPGNFVRTQRAAMQVTQTFYQWVEKEKASFMFWVSFCMR